MRTIPLTATPNQTVSVLIDAVRFTVTLKDARGVMVTDVAVDGAAILTGSRVVAGEAFIPYRYLERGNFFLLTENDDLPAWAEFGASQTLVYLTADEMAVTRG